MPTINVRATTTDHRAVLWERHPAHPDGEVYIAADGRIVAAADTPLVREYIRTGRLAEVQEPPAPPDPELELADRLDASEETRPDNAEGGEQIDGQGLDPAVEPSDGEGAGPKSRKRQA